MELKEEEEDAGGGAGSCPACSRERNDCFPSDLPSIGLLSSSSLLSFHLRRRYLFNTHLNPLPFFLPFTPPSPPSISGFSPQICGCVAPPTPRGPLMFDKGPLKCADFRGCLADGWPGLRGGLPSQRGPPLPPPLSLTPQPGTATGAGHEQLGCDGQPRRSRAAGLGLFGRR